MRLLLYASLSVSVGFLASAQPVLHEIGHNMTLFADAPDIVTPIGMAIDRQDRIFVIESHTHNPPKDYSGPKSDRVKRFIDSNNDGRADRVDIFAEGLHQAMNLAFSPDGTLYALCANELVALPDANGDGVCDGTRSVLKLETQSGNPHGNWLGIAFDSKGKVYLGRGNVGSYAHRVVGKDGSIVEGFGDGGDVIRTNADGTEVEAWATGFWNPMDFIFDRKDRLMLVDNDPDARGPNRLLRVVRGGDYGYKSVFGGSGRHPFQGWDGTLPGTLPYLSGTGEAPSGIIDASSSENDSYLITIWNENTIERHTVIEGQVQKTIFASGDKNFRPVALAYDSRGNLFITDWMLVDYPNHGQGRIWRVTNMHRPQNLDTTNSKEIPNSKTIRQFLLSNDPFQRHTGEMWLSQPQYKKRAELLSEDSDPRVRLGATLAMRRSQRSDGAKRIRTALADPDPSVRRIALMWAGEHLDPRLRDDLDKALTAGDVDKTLFEAYLAAVEMLEPSFVENYTQQLNPRAYKIVRKLDPQLLLTLAHNVDLKPSVRALAIERLSPTEAMDLLDDNALAAKLAALRRTAQLNRNDVAQRLMDLALDESEDANLRAEALLGLTRQSIEQPEALISLMDHTNPTIAIEACRTLRLLIGNTAVRQAFVERYPVWLQASETALAEIAEAALHGFDPHKPLAGNRPQDLDAWKEALAKGGNADRGSRVFRSPQTLCASCHSMDGRGNEFGPNLSGIAESIDRSRIVHAILRPSDSFSPDFQAWTIKTKDGNSHQGVQIDHQSRGDILLYTVDARQNIRFKADEILDYEASPHSLMPPGLENTMTVSEFRDLIAYLSSFK